MVDYNIIRKELNFDLADTKSITAIIIKKLEEQQTRNITEKNIIKYWEDYCFRAIDFEEIEEYYWEEVFNIKDLFNIIYLLPSGLLAIIV